MRHVVILGLLMVPMNAETVVAASRPFELTTDPNQPDSVVTIYNPFDGMVTVQGNRIVISSYQLESMSGLFRPDNVQADFIAGRFDFATEFKMFTLRTSGVTELVLGSVLPPGMEAKELLSDLRFDGSCLPGLCTEAPGGGPYLYWVPEPYSATLLLLGAVVFLHRQRISHVASPLCC